MLLKKVSAKLASILLFSCAPFVLANESEVLKAHYDELSHKCDSMGSDCNRLALASGVEDAAAGLIIGKKGLDIQLVGPSFKSAERCSNVTILKDTRLEPSSKAIELVAVEPRLPICAAYTKERRLLANKNFNLFVSEGSYIITYVDENGEYFQICFDDYWNIVDCSVLYNGG